MLIGWPSIAASASMPPTPQPSTPSPLTIGVCESVPTSVSQYAWVTPPRVAGEDDAGEVLQVDLVADAGVRRHDEEVVEGLLGPAQQLVALLVALELEVGVDPERARAAEGIRDHGVVDDELRRDERVDLLRVAAERGHGVAHRDQVDHAGHAGEVLQQHPGRRVLDLRAVLRGRIPLRDRAAPGPR